MSKPRQTSMLVCEADGPGVCASPWCAGTFSLFVASRVSSWGEFVTWPPLSWLKDADPIWVVCGQRCLRYRALYSLPRAAPPQSFASASTWTVWF